MEKRTYERRAMEPDALEALDGPLTMGPTLAAPVLSAPREPGKSGGGGSSSSSGNAGKAKGSEKGKGKDNGNGQQSPVKQCRVHGLVHLNTHECKEAATPSYQSLALYSDECDVASLPPNHLRRTDVEADSFRDCHRFVDHCAVEGLALQQRGRGRYREVHKDLAGDARRAQKQPAHS